MKKVLKYICIFMVLAVSFALIYTAAYATKHYNIERLDESEIKHVQNTEARKLMIVAHPDDETIWGGMHLLQDDYFVVCITNGYNNERSEEFKKVLEATGSDGIILNYPDKVFDKRDDWELVMDNIIADIKTIIDRGDWELIVTHNPKGEYGHAHHKMTSAIVTGICERDDITEKLWYFGKYYKKTDVGAAKGDDMTYSGKELEEKEKVLDLYASQRSTRKKLAHMNPYEDWIQYDEWEDEK